MIWARAIAPKTDVLDRDAIGQTLHQGLEGQFTGQKVLVLIPDHTRTIPLTSLFRLAVNILHDSKRLDFMVALGTHPPLSEKQLCRLVGITLEERTTTYRHIGLFNHTWNTAETLITIGELSQSQVKEIAGERWHPTLGDDVAVNVNRLVLDYDHIIILGPTFLH